MALIEALLDPGAYPHPVERVELLETHISWVLLTGPYAYKIKKPVNLGFVDFTTLERRRHFCQEELRLNRRLAPALYDAVVPVLGPAERPRIGQPGSGGEGEVIELAVRMHQFPQENLLPAALARGAVDGPCLDRLALDLARFQGAAACPGPQESYGSAAAVLAPVEANFLALEAATALRPRLEALERWSHSRFEELAALLPQRRQAGRVRECHGDLHLGNMALLEGRITVFDALEFSPALRWVDVISEMAFLVMDLQQSGCSGFANRLRNRWLEWCGDYHGLRLWRWYAAYRALVRAKVGVLRALQRHPDPLQEADTTAMVESYVALAETQGQSRPRALVLTHGVSGSGKSHHSLGLCEQLELIRLRSDVERKRLAGLWGEPRPTAIAGDLPLYGEAMDRLLFEHHLPEQVEATLAGGYTALVDATFLRREQRLAWAQRAAQWGVPLVILSFDTPPELARQRIAQRRAAGHDPSDADEAVLEQQWSRLEPLDAKERTVALPVRPDQEPAETAAALRKRLGEGLP
ncbi:MAG: AAA family ATPase [Prochlorococcaceae cyanobacterium]|jgi:aminoglycoside phosphotransferase family enzyme/predicted kinase